MPDITYPPASNPLWRSIREGSEFFMKDGDIYTTLRRLAHDLDESHLDYALIGGLALVAHGYRRFTEDIDVLMTPDTLAAFREHFVGRGYLPAFAGASKTFRDTQTGVKIKIVTAGEYLANEESDRHCEERRLRRSNLCPIEPEIASQKALAMTRYPGDGKPKAVSFPDPADARLEREGLWLITLEKLIELKLASGLSAPHRLKDLADVQELIVRLKLPLELADRLDASVRPEYQRLWQIAQTIPSKE